MAKINYNSYLKFSDLWQYGEYQFFDVPNFPVLQPNDEDRFIDIDANYAGRPDLIAFDEYGDSELYWVLCLANDIMLPPTGFYLNRRIRIPSLSYVKQLIRGTES